MKQTPWAGQCALNQQGYVLVTTLLVMLILVILGTFALNSTTMELRIAGNDRQIKEDFFNQEGCVITGQLRVNSWLTASYLTGDEGQAFFPGPGTDSNLNGVNDASECLNAGDTVVGAFKVRNIVENASTPIEGWEDLARFGPEKTEAAKVHPANQFPLLAHRDKPDPVSDASDASSAYDAANFEIRRFAITSYAPAGAGQAIVQQGVYKVFNRY